MQCLDSLTKIEYGQGTSIALGYFDGVHLGHRAVLGAAVGDSAAHGLVPAAFTFALPAQGGFKGKRILTPEEKRRRIDALGIRLYLRPPFEAFCALSPEQFVRGVLHGAYGARAVFCGENFTFGRDKAGTVETLRALCADVGIRVGVVPMAQYAGSTISSTRIRRHLESGDIEGVNAMLGEDYAVDFAIRHGRQIGRTLGFPTINQIYPAGVLVPRSGVYVTEVLLSDGSRHAGATGLGSRPTVNDNAQDVTCETFMPGFAGELYGQTARVRFCHFLWPTHKFADREELAAMVRRAAEQSLAWHAAHGAQH